MVSTDHSQIEKSVSDLAFSKCQTFSRAPENAQDHSTTESAMLEYIKQSDLADEDIFILVQATSPFTTARHFSEALEIFSRKENDSLLTVTRIWRFFWEENGTPINYDYKNRPRRQDHNGTLIENGAFYINTVGNIIKDKNRLSGNIALYEMPEHTALELDEPTDWIIAEQLIKKHA